MSPKNCNWLILLTLAAGMAVSTQAAVNGQLRTAVQSPVLAAFISFTIGTVLLGAILLLSKQEIPPMRQLSEVELYKYSVGLLGAFFLSPV